MYCSLFSFRAVLASSDDGPDYVWYCLHCLHHYQHPALSPGLQEDQSGPEAQVRLDSNGSEVSLCIVVVIVGVVSCVNFSRISMRREAAISKEINAELNASSGKKLSKAEKDERSVPHNSLTLIMLIHPTFLLILKCSCVVV